MSQHFAGSPRPRSSNAHLQEEDPSALHIPHAHHVLQQSFGPSAQPSADWNSGKADLSKDIVTKTSRCSAFIHTPEVLYKASQQCQPSFTDGSQDSTRTQTICPIPSSRVVRQKQIPDYRPGLIQAWLHSVFSLTPKVR